MAQKPSEKTQDFRQIDQWHKKGKKLAKGGLFSKANPDDAEKEFDRAVKELRKMRPATFESINRMMLILEDMALAQTEMSLNNQAAKSMEDGARAAVNNPKIDVKDTLRTRAVKFYEQSSMYFLYNKQYEKACKQLVLAANLATELGGGSEESIQKSIDLFDRACSIEEEENRYQMGAEFFDAAIKYCIQQKKFVPCNDFLTRQIKSWENNSAQYYKRIFGNICALMIIQFHLKDVKSAQRIYNDAVMKYQNLNQHCGQQKLCEQLLQVFETADEEGLQKIQKSGDLGVMLLNSVSRLAKKLTMQDITPSTITVTSGQNDAQTEQIKDEVKEDVTDEQLVSTVADTQVDEEGAPDLLS